MSYNSNNNNNSSLNHFSTVNPSHFSNGFGKLLPKFEDKRGYLIKKGGSVESWKRRLFVLEQNKLFYYAHVKHEKENNAKGEILLSASCQVGLVDPKIHEKVKKGNCMWLNVPEIPRIFYASAESFDEIDVWIKVLQNNIKVLQYLSNPALTQGNSSPNSSNIIPSINISSSPDEGGSSSGATVHFSPHLNRSTSGGAKIGSPTSAQLTSKSRKNPNMQNYQSKHRSPSSGDAWKIYSGINSPRAYAALFIYNQNVYIYGGVLNDQPLSDLWTADVEIKKWEMCAQKGDIPPPRLCAATAFYKNYLFVFGGKKTSLEKMNDLHRLDLETMTWTRLETEGIKPSPRSSSQLVAHEGKLYLCGGESGNGPSPYLPCYNDLYEYDIDANIWKLLDTNIPDMDGRMSHTLVAYNGILYCYGGTPSPSILTQSPTLSSFYMYNIETNTWTRMMNGPPLFGHTCFITKLKLGNSLTNGLCMVLCGVPGVSVDVESAFFEMFAYDFDTRTWFQLPTSEENGPNPVLHHCTCVYQDSRLLLFGGVDVEDGDYSDFLMEYQLRS